MAVPARWAPPVPVSSASQKTSFAYESTVKRWPVIITSIINELSQQNHELLAEPEADKLRESKLLINELAGLIYEMRHNKPLTPLSEEAQGFPRDAKLYNEALEEMASKGDNLWFTTSWLYAECYMYRRVRTLFSSTQHWTTYDPFLAQKQSAFRSSAKGVFTLAESVQKLVKAGKVTTDKELESEWTKMLDICLWGNATDLSLLTSLTHEDIQALQSVERGADYVLKNDLPLCWNRFKDVKNARVDIVLDNSGFELYSDLVLADWLITLSPFCSEVVFHPKLIPWFVSDVTPFDFKLTITSLLDPSFFPADDVESSPEGFAALTAMVTRWKKYIDDGKFTLSVPADVELGAESSEAAGFWTSPSPYSDLPSVAPELLADLQKSSLVIFKGDLNYRKLTSDGCWPTTTPFVDTLGPLAGRLELLSLRTCKADVCVGLAEGKEAELNRDDPSWRVSGKYAVISFVPRNE